MNSEAEVCPFPLARHAMGQAKGVGLRGAWSNTLCMYRYVYIHTHIYIWGIQLLLWETRKERGLIQVFLCSVQGVISQQVVVWWHFCRCNFYLPYLLPRCAMSHGLSNSVRYQGVFVTPLSAWHCCSGPSLLAASSKPQGCWYSQGVSWVDFRPWVNFTFTAEFQFNANILASYLVCLPST